MPMVTRVKNARLVLTIFFLVMINFGWEMESFLLSSLAVDKIRVTLRVHPRKWLIFIFSSRYQHEASYSLLSHTINEWDFGMVLC
jgi:hypothetical protein